MNDSRADIAILLVIALARDARFAALMSRMTTAAGEFGFVHWVRSAASDVDDGIAIASEDGTADVDCFRTIDRVAAYLLDRGLQPAGTIPPGDALTTYTVWAAHQR